MDAGQVPFADRLRAAAELLESVAEDRALLAGCSPEERMRLFQAAGQVFCPDVGERRRLVKATQRIRKADKLKRDESVLAETGIRKLRRQSVFTTPNLPPPPDHEPREVVDD
ncbi:MAG: oxidoreductase, partial [Verrucomicrobiota bacterium]